MLHQLPEPQKRIEQISRLRWSVAAGETLVSVLRGRPETLAAIVARGENEFLRIAGKEYADHEFHQEDLKRIFTRLQRELAAVSEQMPRG